MVEKGRNTDRDGGKGRNTDRDGGKRKKHRP